LLRLNEFDGLRAILGDADNLDAGRSDQNRAQPLTHHFLIVANHHLHHNNLDYVRSSSRTVVPCSGRLPTSKVAPIISDRSRCPFKP
jgi:hypothetical protein